jgi:polar amino acid transport system substrate-binding protein
VGGILKTSERVRKYDYTDYIFVESVFAYYNKTRPLQLSRLSDLAGKRVGILRGWSYGEAFDVAVTELGIKVETDSTAEASFRRLQPGHLDAVLALDEVGTNLMAGAKYPNVVRANRYVRQNPSYIALRKGSGHAAMVKKLNKSILRMRTSGQLWTVVLKQINSADPADSKVHEGEAGVGLRRNKAQ